MADGQTLRQGGMMETKPAAGPWQTGDPPREGRYLIEYRQGRVQRPFIGDWIPYEGRWSSLPGDAEVIRWAEINLATPETADG